MKRLALWATLFWVAGCLTPKLTWLGGGKPAPAIAESVVQLELGPCQQDVTRVAMLSGPESGDGSTAGALADMKELAAEAGIEGVCGIVCAPPGTVGAGSCTGVGYRRAQ